MKAAAALVASSLLCHGALSLSYLENLNRANPVLSFPAEGKVANGASYLDALHVSASSPPSGGGMTSYLDSLPKNAAPSTAGAGMASYTDSLSGGVASTSVVSFGPVSTEAPPTSPVEPIDPPSTLQPVSTGNYMDSISRIGSAGAPSGGGVTNYLDTLPRGSSPSGGAGIPTYKDNLPVTNAVAGSGAGMSTYTDNLSGDKGSPSNSFTPFGSSPKSTSFVGSVSGSKIDFTLEAQDLASLVEQLRKSGGTIKLSGHIDSISID